MQLKNKHRFSFGLKVATVVGLLCVLALAQQTLGDISGTVTDQSGAVIPNAEVTIKNQSTGVEQHTTTDDQGRFKASVPPGIYEITVAVTGFRKFRVSDVAVRIGQSATVDVTIRFETAPGDEGLIDPTWNAWAEPASPTPSFSPVPFLEPGDKSYSLILDLAAFAYEYGPGVHSKPAGGKLKDWLLKSKAPDVDLKLLIIPDERFFRTARRTETLRIDLKRFRHTLNKGVDNKISEAFELLQQNPVRDFSFGRVAINLRTLDQEGTGSVAIAIWADGVMPVDELSIPLCVASNAEAAKQCKAGDAPHDSLAGIDPLQAAAQQEVFALKPDGALHFIQLDASTHVGIFRDNAWPEGEYVSWRLGRSAESTRQYLEQTLLPNFDRAASDTDLIAVGSELYNLLFPTRASEARSAFDQFIQRHRNRKDSTNPASIFVRMLSDDGEQPPFLIPLGAMVHNIDGKQDFLGFNFRIQTPLEIQDYQPYSKCIGSWVVLAPQANASGIPKELNEARERFSNSFSTWEYKPIHEMNSFIEWAGEDVSETKPVSLFILAHQSSNALYFEENPRLGSEGIERRFKTPSVAIVNGCSTGAPGSSEIVQKLNWNGVSAIIATAAKVDKYLAGDFFSVFVDYLTASPKGSEYRLGVAHFLALQKLRSMRPDSISLPYGAKVLAYQLLGNSSLRVCSPPRKSKPQKGTKSTS